MDTEFIHRTILPGIIDHLDAPEITLITGPRQAGKTTLMRILEQDILSRREHTVFLSLDSEQDAKFFSSQQSLLDKLRLTFGQGRGYVFIDEIQRKENAGLFLKGIYDMQLPYKFIVSGSGSMELKARTHESLAGRKLIFEVYPLSLFEFADFRTSYRYKDRLGDFFRIDKDGGARILAEYLQYGGYPRIVRESTATGKARLMDEIYRSYIEKDISALLRVEKLDAFRMLVELLAGQSGQLVNFSELSTTLGISLETVRNYLWYLEQTYIVERVTPYFQNKRKEITKSPTFSFIDLGLRNYILGTFGITLPADRLGMQFQNLVFLLLRDRVRYTNSRIHFWRTKDKSEVDFVLDRGSELIPFEVKSGALTKPTVPKSLANFIAQYHPQRAFIVTKEYRAETTIDRTIVSFIPFFELFALPL